MIGDPRELLDGAVGVAGADIEIAEGVDRVQSRG